MGSILFRMSEFAREQGLSINKLEATLGASKGVFAKALKGDGNTSTQWVEKFCSIYNTVSPEWLLLGEGEMMRGAQPSECSSNTSQSTDNTEIEQLRQEIARLKDEKIKLLEKIVSLQDTH